MEKKCKVCGTTENVNFMGMCQDCYNNSVVIREKMEEDEKERNENNIKWKRNCSRFYVHSCDS